MTPAADTDTAAAAIVARGQPPVAGGRLADTLSGVIIGLLALAAMAQVADAGAACTPAPVCAAIAAQKMVRVPMAAPAKDTRCLALRSSGPQATAPTISHPPAHGLEAVHLQRAGDTGVAGDLDPVEVSGGGGGSCRAQTASGGGEATVVSAG